MRHLWKLDLQRELSWFLIAYLLMFLSVLVLVHALQPEREGGSSRSPVHQKQQQTTAKHVATQTGATQR